MGDHREGVPRRTVLRSAAVGAGGIVVAGASGRARAQTSHTVEMNDALRFVPAELTVAPGDTVVWETVGSVGHSVTAYEDRIPDGTAYFASGGFAAEAPARTGYPEGDVASGETFEYTFETEGAYEYFCVPHESAGMVGSVTVQEGGGGAGGGDGGGGPTVPSLPDSARTLALATLTAMGSVLGLAYFFMKYGGDYAEAD